MNIYGYINNDPINYIDPEGKIGVCLSLWVADAVVTLFGIASLADDLTKTEPYEKLDKIDKELWELKQKSDECKDVAEKAKIAGEIAKLNGEAMKLQKELGISGVTLGFGAGSLALSVAAAVACAIL